MRLLGFDAESTGLCTATSRITEIGVCLWDTDTARPLTTIGVFLKGEGITPLSEEITRITGITDAMLEEFGTDPKENLTWLDGFCKKHGVEYLVAHNAEGFDKPLLMAELNRHGVEAACLRALPWIDTRTDIPFPTEPDSRKLKHLALDLGFINPFSHRAVFDVLTMLRVLSHYDINAVIEYSKIPFVTVRGMVSYDERQLAKDQRFSWEKIGDKTYPKCWVKRIKVNKLDEEQAKCSFKVVRIE